MSNLAHDLFEPPMRKLSDLYSGDHFFFGNIYEHAVC